MNLDLKKKACANKINLPIFKVIFSLNVKVMSSVSRKNKDCRNFFTLLMILLPGPTSSM
jgi:hypothetical protein